MNFLLLMLMVLSRLQLFSNEIQCADVNLNLGKSMYTHTVLVPFGQMFRPWFLVLTERHCQVDCIICRLKNLSPDMI